MGLADVVHRRRLRGRHPPAHASRRSPRCRRCPSATTPPRPRSRPYSVDRDGFVMGEGAAALVLETEEHAKARGAKIYGEIVGGGVTADSYHITAPEPEGLGASRAVRQALEQAGATPDDVTHINAHATSTPTGDIAEYKALLIGLRRPHPRDPGLGDEGLDRSPARRHRRARGDLHDPRAPRPAGAADDQPVDAGSRDPAAHLGRADAARRRSAAGDQQLVRLRRPQRRRRVPLGLETLTVDAREDAPGEACRGRLSCQAVIRFPAARDSWPPSIGSGASNRLSLCECVGGQPTLWSQTTGASSLA